MKSKFSNFILLTFFTLFIIWALGWLWFATTIAMTQPNNTTTKTDAIVVLTGGNGRINKGLDLLVQKRAPKLFISGVNKDVTKEDILKNWLKNRKETTSPPCCIFLGYESTDTISNATEVKAWVADNNIGSLRLITSSYHMPRAFLEIEKQIPNTTIIKHPVFSSDFESWDRQFWKLSFGEYNKTILRKMQNMNQ